MFKFCVVAINCYLATASPINDRVAKLEMMVAEQQNTIQKQEIAFQQALEKVGPKHQLSGTNILRIILGCRRLSTKDTK